MEQKRWLRSHGGSIEQIRIRIRKVIELGFERSHRNILSRNHLDRINLADHVYEWEHSSNDNVNTHTSLTSQQ